MSPEHSTGEFYRWFGERRLTGFGERRRQRTQRLRLATIARYRAKAGDLLELGPGTGSFAEVARAAGWRYQAIEASPSLAAALVDRGFLVTQAWTPPFPVSDQSFDVVYADQIVEHMSGIDAARLFVAESYRALRPGGLVVIVVPNYLAEGAFFWDVDYTHNFVTTERRLRQLAYDGGFEILECRRQIGAAEGVAREALALLSFLSRAPGLDAIARYARAGSALFAVRKNLFETLTLVGRRGLS